MNRLPFAPLSLDASLTSAWHLTGDVFQRLSSHSQQWGEKRTETSLAATGNKTAC